MGFEVKEEWKKVKLGEYCTVTSSKRFNISERSSSGIPFFCSKEIIQKVNGQEITECDYIKEEAYENIKRQFGVPKCGDLLITTRGTYGIPYIYKENDCFYFADGNLTWIKDFDNKLNVEYLYYWIKSYEGQKKIDAIAKGTAQKAVPILAIKNLELNLPPLPTQQKIAAILSAYDDLIENNRAQIKLLEEAAQKLYKEWFVKLNFPGHETTEIIDGIPAGWRKGVLSDVGEFKRGKTITKSQAGKGNIPVIAGGINPAYYTDKSNTLSPVITISASGNAGYVRLYNEKVWASDCSFLDISSSNCFYYVYIFLKYNQKNLYSLQKGACQQHVSAKDINALEIVIPCNEVLVKFETVSKPYFDKIKNCQVAISNLRSARDKLLPKLMSGQVEV
ncbi:MAG: restriction endonuclease subunit S [Treponema sp.]|nr:restriction endonuclease subunit S [Spirochaetia bacterium]MDD7458743.1 restriction endonuclease subunit S [Spirochaetales bacterium]MDY5812236.1 restriction endonuclease subunit S [Treponema sp.]